MANFNIPPIQSEKEYFEYLKRIVEGAEYLENPLTDPGKRKKFMRLYDELCQRVLEYRGMTS